MVFRTLLFIIRKFREKSSIIYDKNKNGFQKSIIFGNKFKKGLELYSGFWITRFRHFKWNSSKGTNKIYQNELNLALSNREINNLIKINNINKILKQLKNTKEQKEVRRDTEKYSTNYKKLSFLKVINKTWVNTNIFKRIKTIKIKAENSNWILPSFSERHLRIIRVDNTFDDKKSFLIKIKLKDSELLKEKKENITVKC